MPRKIGKFFSSTKSKIFGSGSSPSKKASGSSSSVAVPGTSGSDGAGDFSTADTEPILGSRSKSASRESFGPGGSGVQETLASRSSSFGSSQKLKSKSASRDNVGDRGPADGAEEDLNLGGASMADGTKPLNLESGAAPVSGFRRFFSFGPALTSTTGYNELYTEQKDLHQKSWWHSTFTMGLGAPVLFGTWDGVFVTCVVHLFGVISFLRTGWLVGNEGILLGGAIVFGCLLFTTISLLAAIGIMERCAAATSGAAFTGSGGGIGLGTSGMQHFDPEYPSTVASARANVHLLISTVLGSRIGGAISLIYWFGQAVSCALHITGFTETFVQFAATFIERHLWENAGNLDTDSTPWDARLARTLARLMWIEVNLPSGAALTESARRALTITITPVTHQIVSGAAIFVLFLFNVLGVKCLFRLQSVLFIALVMAVLDFGAGLFVRHSDFGYGRIVSSAEHLRENLYPNVPTSSPDFWPHLFTIIGIFFPSAIGVMAGVNMGSDLKNPTRSIPVGSLSAIVSSYALHLLFIVGLGVSCTRVALLRDYSISQHVSALGWFFMSGLYMSALSSSLGSMYTAPRILQNLAQELHSLPVVRCFAIGRGPNKIPINALILFTLVTLCFVMMGGINVLAPIVTIPYLLTYATIEYAYFSMAMTFDIQISREKRFMAIASQLRSNGEDGGVSTPDSATGATTRIIEIGPSDLGPRSPPPNENTALTDTSSLSLLKISDIGPEPPSPTPSMQHLEGYGSVQAMTAHIKIKRRQSTQSSSDSDTDDEMKAFAGSRLKKSSSRSRNVSGSPGAPQSPRPPSEGNGGKSNTPTPGKVKAKTIKQLMAAESDEESEEEDGGDQEVLMTSNGDLHKTTIFRFETSDLPMDRSTSTVAAADHYQNLNANADHTQEPNENEVGERLLNPDPELAEIACKQETWYLRLMNRWIVLIAALAKFALMFFIAWHYALVTVAAFVAFYLIIGKSNPGFYPGVSEFVLVQWLKNIGRKLFRRKAYQNGNSTNGSNLVASYSYDRIVLPPTSMPNPNYQSEVLTRENTDYSSRKGFHHSTTINPQFD